MKVKSSPWGRHFFKLGNTDPDILLFLENSGGVDWRQQIANLGNLAGGWLTANPVLWLF